MEKKIDDKQPSFAIEIDFEKNSENPSRVFKTMTQLIESFEILDRDLVKSIDPKIEPIALIEDIETGSIKAWLKYTLESIDEDALKELDWKKAVGSYLVKGKRILVDFCSEKTTITDKEELDTLSGELEKLAIETDVRKIPAYSKITNRELLPNLQNISNALSNLKEFDNASYISDGKKSTFNAEFNIVPEDIESMLTRISLSNVQEMILKVKKPDYLGDSQWEFRHEYRIIRAKISDAEWLNSFQSRNEDVRPGDSLHAKVEITVNYGYDNEVVSQSYTVLQVIDKINADEEQFDLIDNENEENNT